MKKFQYQIIRYVHDQVTSEFVNVGIVVYQPDIKFLQCKVITRFGRISNFFNDLNGQSLLSTLKQIEKEVCRTSKQLTELFFDCSSLEEITNSILPKDNSALEFSELRFGIDIDFKSAVSDLFNNMVDKYSTDFEKDPHDDLFAWRRVYKQYFDKYGITGKLKSHTVKTENDDIEFTRAWKNGVWNCYQPLSFDLKRKDSIKNKVYKWSGIINAIEQSNQQMHLYFLTVNGTKDFHVKSFIEQTLTQRPNKSITVTLVNEQQADSFVANLKQEIESHV